jgi:signal transduction histidine kinase
MSGGVVSAYHYDPMLWPTLGSAAFIGTIALYLWRRRATTKGALPLALVALLLALWCLGGAAEVAATDIATQRAWFLLRDALTIPSVVLAFWFALAYAGLERWLTRPVVAVLAGVTIAHVALDLVDGGRLAWSSIVSDQQIQGDRTALGLAFAGFALAMFVLSTAVFLLLFVRSPAHRTPVALILIGQVAIRVLYPLGVFNIVYVPNIVSGVVGFDCVAVMYAVALFRFRLFDLVPVARQTILAHMPDGLLALDAGDRVVDVNETVLRLLHVERRAVLGRPVAAAFAAFPDIARDAVGRGEASVEVCFDSESGARIAEVSSTPLSDWQGKPIGRLVLLHDITALRRVEAQLVEQERALAAAGERGRLARELHDGLAQDLWLAKLKATRLAAQPELGPEARALNDEVTAAIDAGIAEARQAVATMRVASSAANGTLRELLSRSLEDFEDRFGLSVEFDCSPDLPALSSRAEAETLRIVQEALTNVRRHADATVVRVRGGIDDGRLVLEVRDNGCGFDPGSVGDDAYGLAGMRERAARIGAELEIESAPRQGTLVRLRVSASLPVEAGVP